MNERRVPPTSAILYWTLWLALFFLPAELFAAFLTPGKADTFTEFTWWLTENKRWKRGIVLAFGVSLIGHLVWQWTVVPVAIFGAGFGVLIVLGVRRQARIEEVLMSLFWQKAIVSAAYGVAAVAPLLTAILSDGKILGVEWAALITAFIGGWGKFSSNTTILAPARKGETVTKFGPDPQK